MWSNVIKHIILYTLKMWETKKFSENKFYLTGNFGNMFHPTKELRGWGWW